MNSDTAWEARIEDRYADKSGWYAGPWLDEPDRVEWRYHGTPRFPLLIVRGPSGALCGYVGVSPGHPLHDCEKPFDLDLDVHGGITYGQRCQESGHICHVPRNGESPDVFWLGFDCAHTGDYSYMDTKRESAAVLRTPPDSPFAMGTSYRSLQYVRREVESLASKLAGIAKGAES